MVQEYTAEQQQVIAKIKRYLFGKQIQSTRTNVAIAAFIYDEFFPTKSQLTLPEFIETAVNQAKSEDCTEEQTWALQMIFGPEICEDIKEGKLPTARVEEETGALIFFPYVAPVVESSGPEGLSGTAVKDDNLKATMAELNKLLRPSMIEEFGDNKEAAALFVASYLWGEKPATEVKEEDNE